ncbi:albumin-binding GA domain-containing protein [Streptococcus didelphis]|nr:albumin-binding GA domain-containing protein [Streptococcus didelphis]
MKNKHIKSYLTKSVIGLASVSAAALMASTMATNVSADSVTDKAYAEKVAAINAFNEAAAMLEDMVPGSFLYNETKMTIGYDAKKAEAEAKTKAYEEAVKALPNFRTEKKAADDLAAAAEAEKDSAITAEEEAVDAWEAAAKAAQLEKAKEAALKELDEAGASDFFKNLISKANTVEGVESLKADVLAALVKSEDEEPEEDSVPMTPLTPAEPVEEDEDTVPMMPLTPAQPTEKSETTDKVEKTETPAPKTSVKAEEAMASKAADKQEAKRSGSTSSNW